MRWAPTPVPITVSGACSGIHANFVKIKYQMSTRAHHTQPITPHRLRPPCTQYYAIMKYALCALSNSLRRRTARRRGATSV